MGAAGETLGFVGLGNIGGPMARRMASHAPGTVLRLLPGIFAD